jgi:hypothetical protein
VAVSSLSSVNDLAEFLRGDETAIIGPLVIIVTAYRPYITASGMKPDLEATAYSPRITASGMKPRIPATGYKPLIIAEV